MITYQLQSKNCKLQVYTNNSSTSKTGILFLHGGPGSGSQPIMDLPAFQTLENNYICTYFDQRGSGASKYDLQQGLCIEAITNDVQLVALDMLERWHLDHIILWGGSFGGCLACLCLELFPQTFSGVILSSPAITFNRTQSIDFFNRMKEPYKSQLPKDIQTAFQSMNSLTPEEFLVHPQVRSFIFSKRNPSNSLRHICAMADWFYQHYFSNLFEKIQLPTLILQGVDDPICFYKNLDKKLKETSNPQIHYYLYNQCGHAVFEDKEKEFVDVILNFIKDLELC